MWSVLVFIIIGHCGAVKHQEATAECDDVTWVNRCSVQLLARSREKTCQFPVLTVCKGLFSLVQPLSKLEGFDSQFSRMLTLNMHVSLSMYESLRMFACRFKQFSVV